MLDPIEGTKNVKARDPFVDDPDYDAMFRGGKGSYRTLRRVWIDRRKSYSNVLAPSLVREMGACLAVDSRKKLDLLKCYRRLVP